MRFYVLVLSLVLAYQWVDAQDKVKLADIKTLTLRKGAMTTGKRTSPVLQTQCLDSPSVQCNSVEQPSVIQCTNSGSDGLRINWECKAEFPLNIRFYEVKVGCEGYDSPTDPYVLYGSCGLKYSLERYQSGAQPNPVQPPYVPPRGNDVYDNNNYRYTTKKSKGGILGGIISGSVIGGLIVICLCVLGVFCICKMCCGKCGGGGRKSYGGGDGGGHYTPAPTIPSAPTPYYPPAPAPYNPAPTPYNPAPAYYPSGENFNSGGGGGGGGGSSNTGGGKHESVGFAVTENR